MTKLLLQKQMHRGIYKKYFGLKMYKDTVLLAILILSCQKCHTLPVLALVCNTPTCYQNSQPKSVVPFLKIICIFMESHLREIVIRAQYLSFIRKRHLRHVTDIRAWLDMQAGYLKNVAYL